MELYLNNNVSSLKILNFIKKCKENNIDIHCFQFYKNNELQAKVEVLPYSNKQRRQLYSLSKSFTSTAIGIACDKGLLSVNDKVIDFFKDKLPENVSENMKLMTVHHLLSMNTGHEKCVMNIFINQQDPIKEFFNTEVKFKPGTHFVYNTGASFILSAIIQKLTGLTLFDFLTINMFNPLDIKPDLWQDCDDINAGGYGLHICCDDVVKLGLLYLNKGIYNGKRIISEEWVNKVQMKHSDNSNGCEVAGDWNSGYGYQFWRCVNGGYRADGAHGQLCLIVPSKNIVFAALAECTDMQTEINFCNDYFNDFEKTTDENIDLKKELLTIYQPYCSNIKVIDGFNKLYKTDTNKQGITLINLQQKDDILSLDISNGNSIQTIKAGNGEWLENSIYLPFLLPTLKDLISNSESCLERFMASYKIVDNNKAVIGIRYINCPHKGEYILTFDNDCIKLEICHTERTVLDNAKFINGKVI